MIKIKVIKHFWIFLAVDTASQKRQETKLNKWRGQKFVEDAELPEQTSDTWRSSVTVFMVATVCQRVFAWW